MAELANGKGQAWGNNAPSFLNTWHEVYHLPLACYLKALQVKTVVQFIKTTKKSRKKI